MYPTKKLGELCDILDNKRRPVTASDRIPGPYPYYGATGIQDYVDKYIFDEDLVLIGEDGAKWGAGENSAFPIFGKTWVNNHAHVVRPFRDNIFDKWLIYYLNMNDLSKYITGATVKKLNQERLRSIPIPTPSLLIQQKIVSKLDSSFANINNQIEKLKNNFSNIEDLNKSVLEGIFLRNNYKKIKIENLFKIRSGNFLPKSKMIEIGDIDVYGGNGINGKHNEYNLDGDYIIIGRVLALCGNVRLINGKLWLTDNAFYISEYLEKEIFKPYLKIYLEYARLGDTANQMAQPVISFKSISDIQVPIPTFIEQKNLVNYIEQVFNKNKTIKQKYEQQILKLEELKQSLLKDAFEGRLVSE